MVGRRRGSRPPAQSHGLTLRVRRSARAGGCGSRDVCSGVNKHGIKLDKWSFFEFLSRAISPIFSILFLEKSRASHCFTTLHMGHKFQEPAK